ncbi:MAG: family 10 glycosylhydrolase [Coleofasciculus sp. S288]|nr:family 10 glycosylhydrolase [Coleofasciculus sp. S288]
MVSNSTPFSDIQNHWARLFIEALAQRGIISGFPNGTFRPNNSMTRAEFAAIIAKAFPKPSKRQYVGFVDVPATNWATPVIQKAYEIGFISGFPDKHFRPTDRISRAQVLVSLVNGLEIASQVKSDLLPVLPHLYQDVAAIPKYARDGIAIATRAGLVANYPTLSLLGPNLAATRADVAVFIYQALVYLNEAPPIQSRYIVVPPAVGMLLSTVSVNHRREFRGVWVTTAWNSDWPSKPGLPVEQQKTELIRIINHLKALNFNALVLQVRPEGDALYASKLEPWSEWLTGTQGKAPNPFYDPLEFAIAECHKRNIELHAWFNPYRAKISVKGSPNARPHIALTNPDVVYRWGNYLWMDPGSKVVQDRAYNVILDVVKRYDVDGIHLDDYFYPYPIQGKSFPDNKTYAAYKAGGGKLSVGDWRRDNVNKMVQRLWEGIKATKSHVKFGISPFGIYRPGQPAQIKGLDAYSVLYADAKKWLEQGWVDYIAPQLYWKIDQKAQSYPVLLKWWTDINHKQRHIYTGNNIAQLDGKSWKLQEINKQIDISRNLVEKKSLGNIFFHMTILSHNRQGIYYNFKSSVYAKPALVPTMPWLDAIPPFPPTELNVKNRQLTWKAVNDKDVSSWTLYKQNGGTWTMEQILSGATRAATVEPGTYALCAVDRLANESAGVSVSVK